MYKNYFDLQCRPTQEQIDMFPEFLRVEYIKSVFCKGNDYLVIDRTCFETSKEPEDPRYYKLVLMEDHVFPYPIEATMLKDYILEIKFENGETKQAHIREEMLRKMSIPEGTGSENIKIIIKNNCIYINDELWGAEDIYFSCYVQSELRRK